MAAVHMLNQERKFTLYSDFDNNQIDHLDRTGSVLRDGRAVVIPLTKICGLISLLIVALFLSHTNMHRYSLFRFPSAGSY